MKLEIGNIQVKELVFGENTALTAGQVQIDQQALTGFIHELDHRITEVKLDNGTIVWPRRVYVKVLP